MRRFTIQTAGRALGADDFGHLEPRVIEQKLYETLADCAGCAKHSDGKLVHERETPQLRSK
jgi:hypothetical protein